MNKFTKLVRIVFEILAMYAVGYITGVGFWLTFLIMIIGLFIVCISKAMFESTEETE